MTTSRLASHAQGLRHVFVRDLVLNARVGIYPHEQTTPQRVRINVDLGVDDMPTADPTRRLTLKQELARIVDYEKVANEVRAIVTVGHVRLVETLAERIAAMCLRDRRVHVARVRVEKLDVFPDAAAAGVEIERCQ